MNKPVDERDRWRRRDGLEVLHVYRYTDGPDVGLLQVYVDEDGIPRSSHHGPDGLWGEKHQTWSGDLLPVPKWERWEVLLLDGTPGAQHFDERSAREALHMTDGLAIIHRWQDDTGYHIEEVKDGTQT